MVSVVGLQCFQCHMPHFKLVTSLRPKGDQPEAIDKLIKAFQSSRPYQTLLGVTGSGKTFTMAKVIENLDSPVLVISHNKTLAAQLYSEFKEFFPENAVHYFVSYYDYYQPEAYLPQRDIYIEKDASINENLERLRLAATSALLSRRDVIIIASVSCIYGLGTPEDYAAMTVSLKTEEVIPRPQLLKRLIEMQYTRNETVLAPGNFRVRGETIELFPPYDDKLIRLQVEGDRICKIYTAHSITGDTVTELKNITIFPTKHFVVPEEKIRRAVKAIRTELEERLAKLQAQNKLVEAQRLAARTNYDIEMLQEVGYCKGIENYSRHLSGRLPGQRPFTLIDYFPKDFLTIVDESHATVPQLRGMFYGDRSRKEILVEYGFRLPSALDNRPMKFEEWETAVGQTIFVSATPAPYELAKSRGEVVEQVIRPTGLVDPKITIQSTPGQIEDLLGRIKGRIKNNERVLITTLTKRFAEDLHAYLQDKGIKGMYLHSEIDTIERTRILRHLREGKYDVVVGVNLLREGLDLPEVSLVAILDADKEGFLRSETSLIQTAGRTARNVNGEIILYADTITGSMERAIKETDRRRNIQSAYNKEHHITPRTIRKEIRRGIEELVQTTHIEAKSIGLNLANYDRLEAINQLEQEMLEAAEKLEFEKAAELRDLINELKSRENRDTS